MTHITESFNYKKASFSHQYTDGLYRKQTTSCYVTYLRALLHTTRTPEIQATLVKEIQWPLYRNYNNTGRNFPRRPRRAVCRASNKQRLINGRAGWSTRRGNDKVDETRRSTFIYGRRDYQPLAASRRPCAARALPQYWLVDVCEYIRVRVSFTAQYDTSW